MDDVVRFMTEQDIPQVVDIEEECYGTISWGPGDFRSRILGPSPSYVVETGEKVLGFVVWTMTPALIVIDNTVVHSDHRRRGLGRKLLARVLSKTTDTCDNATTHRRAVAFVPESCVSMQLLLKDFEFYCCVPKGIIRDDSTGADGSPEDTYEFTTGMEPVSQC